MSAARTSTPQPASANSPASLVANTAEEKLPYLGLLAVLFSHWSVEVLTRAIDHAKRMIEIHGGDLATAHLAADEMAYGNVSLHARASMAPTAQVLGAMRKGFA